MPVFSIRGTFSIRRKGLIFIPRKAKFQRQKQELSESLEESERKRQISSALPCGPAVLQSWGDDLVNW